MESRYRETRDQAAQIARQALPFATRHHLPANPTNYAVLYEYFACTNPDLRDEAERILAESRQFSEEAMTDLYQRYIARGDEKILAQIRDELVSILASAVVSVQAVDEDSARYQEHLNAGLSQLKNKVSVDDLRAVVEGLIGETQKMSSSGMRLYEQLQETQKELETVRAQFKHAEAQSLTDPLTQLGNRLALDRTLSELCEEASKTGRPFSLLMIDVDFFKKFNDTYGHTIGDKVLQFVARTAHMLVRGEDLVARYGGEEFAIVLPDTQIEGALQVAEKVRERIQTTPLIRKSSGVEVSRVTVSIGVASHQNSETPASLINRADTALYAAKHQGRNRVCSA